MPSTVMITREPYNGILRLCDGNRPKNFSSFCSLTCKNNVIIYYYDIGGHTVIHTRDSRD